MPDMWGGLPRGTSPGGVRLPPFASMKICFLCEYFYPDSLGGAGTVVSELAHALQDNFSDTQVSAICSDNFLRGTPERTLPRRENWDGIAIRRVRTPPTKRNSGLQRLIFGTWFSAVVAWKLLIGPRYDVLVATTNPPMIAGTARIVSRLRGMSYVFLVHDLYAEMSVVLGQSSQDSLPIRVAQKMQKWFLGGASHVVALGRCMKDHLDNTFELVPEKVRVIPNWGTVQDMLLQGESHLRHQHGATDKFVVLYAGNFGQFHNFNTILDAARDLSERQDIVFWMVGEGARRSDVEARIKSEKLNNVRVFDFVPVEQLADLLGAANVSLVTLERGMEGLAVPSKFYNILASGRASIALMGKNAETARTIEENDCGLRVDSDDSAGLRHAIEILANDPIRCQQMGISARKAFERFYTLRSVAQRFHELFQEIRTTSKSRSALTQESFRR
ncbi:glycosyltransferase WbuB [bacterium]|nr:MAG: glycosyltransferase WbuB [bacterium]